MERDSNPQATHSLTCPYSCIYYASVLANNHILYWVTHISHLTGFIVL